MDYVADNMPAGASAAGYLRKTVSDSPGYNFLHVGAYGMDILDTLREEGFRFSGNVDGEGGAGFSMITDGKATYGIRMGDAGTEYADKVFIAARKMENPDTPDYRLTGSNLHNSHALTDGYLNPGGILSEDPVHDASLPESGPSLAVGREYTRQNLDSMGFRNHGPVGGYLFDGGGNWLYMAEETSTGMNTYRITGAVAHPGRANAKGNGPASRSARGDGWVTHNDLGNRGFRRQSTGKGPVAVYQRGDTAHVMETDGDMLREMGTYDFRLQVDEKYTKEQMTEMGITQEFPFVFTANGGKERYHVSLDGKDALGRQNYIITRRLFNPDDGFTRSIPSPDE